MIKSEARSVVQELLGKLSDAVLYGGTIDLRNPSRTEEALRTLLSDDTDTSTLWLDCPYCECHAYHTIEGMKRTCTKCGKAYTIS